jgi:exodeoxyribonuclease VII large subunit
MEQKYLGLKQESNHLLELYKQHSIEKKLQQKKQETLQLKEQFYHHMQTILNLKQNQLKSVQSVLKSNHPKFKIKNGFAQISKDKKVIDIESLSVGDSFDIQTDKVFIGAKVMKKVVI